MLKSVPSTRPWDVGIFPLHNVIHIVNTETHENRSMKCSWLFEIKRKTPAGIRNSYWAIDKIIVTILFQ